MEIEIIKPEIICLVGSTAAKAFLGKNIKMNQIRGKIIREKEKSFYTIFHPAYVLRGIKSRKPIFYSDIKNLLENF
ncbi:uracil-DNA glycosylase family protein [Persephonella sp. KM09-Lau-8]|uniref:uracil-DNA glycosylase family protein n=1 Tax=Persephonella sp. KM09-Lau-8 TaxID=1158345 RepID=UPI000496D073|nr:uracil-DNA glycosylase family protein [Persephonella sp. KM09-Lau-8]